MKSTKYILSAAGAALLVLLGTAGSDEHKGQCVKLSGTWVGKLGDITWTSTWTPEPSGEKATSTMQWMTLSTDFEGMLALLQADHMSMVSGSVRMVSPDRAIGKTLWYVVADGKLPTSTMPPVAGQIKAVAVMTDNFQFTSSSTASATHELKIYAADPQNPMVPNEAYLFFDQAYHNVPHVKVL